MSKLWAATAAVACLWAGQASAVTTFNDRMTFASHGAGATAFLSLNDLQATLGDEHTMPISVGPLEITADSPTSAYYFAGIHAAHPGVRGDVDGSAWMQMRLDFHSWVTWSSASGFQLIGFDMRPYYNENDNGSISSDFSETIYYETDTGENGSFKLSDSNTSSFLGLMFNAPVHSITFSSLDLLNTDNGNGSSWFGVDNLHVFATAAPVPEPASLAMLLAGLGTVGLLARRRRAG